MPIAFLFIYPIGIGIGIGFFGYIQHTPDLHTLISQKHMPRYLTACSHPPSIDRFDVI